ncbi:retrovirus-related Pol polyprotein from transposon opus [Trichonephila clavipes]|uniref:Retrovirus-related Pol polyprotein from transposon opus n=1 Tax=Trichonephila clavipes TaxID=2585209 RepID=A0A8X6SSV0_TRICX|nr:retrovirus-related Pol polyprotein from transposon opus [Trichonephila clavipes]
MKDGDIVLFITLFERQAKRVSIEKRYWVSALLALVPSEINQLMAREAEEKFDDYDYIKEPHDYTDQSKRRVSGDVREQFVDNWVKSIVPCDLADKLEEYESVRANVKGAHSNDMRYRPTNNKFFSDNKSARYLARECPKNIRKTPPRNARSNINAAKGTELESIKEVVTASVSILVSVPINTRNGIDDLQLVDIKCRQTSIKAVIDTGVQISVLREDLIGKGCGEGEGTIQIISAFGEKEIAALKLFNLKLDNGKHGSVPIMCAVSKKLFNDMLICATAY